MKYIFKLSAFFTLLLAAPGITALGNSAPAHFDKAAFYAAMASADVEEVNSVLSHLKETAMAEKTAYEGALLMKKAGLLSKAKEKLSLFKSGRAKLEAAIKNDEANVEFHFLRLMIQENAPKIVHYQHDLASDSELVSKSFKKLAPVVQQAVRDYSKKSRFLKSADF